MNTTGMYCLALSIILLAAMLTCTGCQVNTFSVPTTHGEIITGNVMSRAEITVTTDSTTVLIEPGGITNIVTGAAIGLFAAGGI